MPKEAKEEKVIKEKERNARREKQSRTERSIWMSPGVRPVKFTGFRIIS